MIKHLYRFIQMFGVFLTICLLSGLGLPINLAHAAPHHGLTSPEEVEDFFDSQIGTQIVEKHIPGATVFVVQDGSVFFFKGYGYANLDPETPIDPERTLFRIASITKLFIPGRP